MKGWRAHVILLLIVLVLGGILFAKISNTHSEKKIVIEDVEEYVERNKGKIMFSVFITNVFSYIPAIALIVGIIGIYKLYIKLGVLPSSVRIFFVSLIVLIGSITLKSIYTMKHGIWAKEPAIYNIAFWVSVPLAGITLITTQLQFFNSIGVRFWWFIVLVIIPYFIGDFIPYGGDFKIICAIILGIIVGFKLAELYNKEGIFKVGLCILPAVFIPILGFKEE